MKRIMRLATFATVGICITLIAVSSWAGAPRKVKPAIPPPPNPLPLGTVGTMQPLLPKADLQVGVVSVTPQNPGEGQEVTFTGNVMNYGAGAALKPVVTLTVAAPSGVPFPIFRKEFNVTLQRNQGITFVQKFRVPKQGNYTCKFTLDPAHMIAETDEGTTQKAAHSGFMPFRI